VLLDPSARGGLIGNLNLLSPIGASVTAPAEVAVLRSRGVVDSVVRPPAAGRPATPAVEGFDLHVGLTTEVTDESRSVAALVLAELGGPVGGRPPVQAPYRLFAQLEPRAEDAPERVRAEFVAPGRVRLTTPSLLARFGLASLHAQELPFAAGQPFEYQGLLLTLVPDGDVAGRAFTLEAVPAYEAAERLLERFYAGETTRNAGVIRLTVEDTDPFRAAETANALVRNYLAEQEARRARRSQATVGYVERLLDDAQAALEEAEQELVQVRTRNPALVNLDASAEAMIEEISAVEAQAQGLSLRERSLTEVLSSLAEGDALALARLDSAVTGGLFVDPITEGYLERIGTLNSEYVELSQVYNDEHPRLAELRGAADDLLRLIRTQIQDRIAGVVFQRQTLEAEVQRKLAALADLPADMQALARPMLVVQTQQALIPELLAHLKATEIADSTSSFAAQLLDPATPATEVASPRLGAVLVIGLALGLALGLLVALIRDPVTGRVRGRTDLEELLPRPLVGTVPFRRRGAPHPGAEDAIRSLRAAIKNLRVAGGPVRLLGVTSVAADDARASVSADLARAFAREGARVALVETDLRRRGLTRLLGLADVPGLAEALRAGDPEPALSVDDIPGLAVVPAGRADASAAELLGGDLFDRILSGLDVGCDLVVVDLPASGRPELEAIAPKLDGLLIACTENQSRRSAVRGARERIERAGGAVLGAVLLAPSNGRGQGR
jgi:uncharacterized protein involved in exopolysaccharide biosynthesis/Mrp family chromosome partitioning ATPase